MNVKGFWMDWLVGEGMGGFGGCIRQHIDLVPGLNWLIFAQQLNIYLFRFFRPFCCERNLLYYRWMEDGSKPKPWKDMYISMGCCVLIKEREREDSEDRR